MSLRSRLLVVLLSLMASVPVAVAQQPPAATGGSGATVHGLVTDPDDALIPGATVTFAPASGSAKPVVGTSKEDGTFSVRVPAGTYIETITAPGFAPLIKQGVRVTAGANLSLDAKLAIAEQSQEMTVTADTVQLSVDPENNASSTVITGEALDALSDDPDELSAELAALAGPSTGPNGGQIYIDGFTGGQLPPKSSILAIRINSNPFSAQYDQLGYGRIEIITKPGTDKFHGNVTAQYGGKWLNTSNPFLGSTNQQPDYHTLFFMGNVTGPIKKGMSFTLSGSHRDINNNSLVNPTAFYATSASSADLCAPGTLTCVSTPFPEQYRALGTPSTRWDVSPRIDMLVGPKNTLTARFQYESGDSNINIPIASPLLQTGSLSNSSEATVQISDTQLISNSVINETRFEYQHTTSNSTPQLLTGPMITVQGGFTAGASTSGVTTTPGDHIEVQNYTSIQLAKNFIRLGGRLRTSSETNTSNGGVNGQFIYSYLLDPCTDPSQTNKPSNCNPTASTPCAVGNTIPTPGTTPLIEGVSSYQCGIISQFKITNITQGTVSARETDVGFYAEDDWKAKPNLTVSYGVRMEAQNQISSTHDFAPRISVAYGIPRKDGKTITVIRAGFGLFYDRFGLGSIVTQKVNNGTNTQDVTYSNLDPSSTYGIACKPTFSGSTITGYAAACLTPSSGTNAQVIRQVLDPNLRAPYTMEEAATLEQQLGKYTSLSVTYLNSRGEHQLLTRNIPLGTNRAFLPVAQGGQLSTINQSAGVYRQNELITNVNIRTSKGITLTGSYTANWANSNISNITDPYNSRTDFGRASFGVRNRFQLVGSVPLPFHITASPFMIANSGSPYSITTGLQDPNTLLYTGRPSFSNSGTFSCKNGLSFNAGSQESPIALNQQIPVNYCVGPANVTINMRLSRTWGFGKLTDAALAQQARAQRAGGGGGGGGGGFGGIGGGAGGAGGAGGFGGGGGGARGGGGGGARGGGGGGRGANTGHKYNLSVGVFAQNLFNEVPYGTPVSSLSNAKFGTYTSLQGGVFSSATAVRRITISANFSF